MITVLAVHFAVAAVAPLLFRRFGRNSFFALAAVPAASFIWLLLQHDAVYSGTVYSGSDGAITEVVPWIPGLQLDLAFRMDALAWVMSLLVLGVGALVLVYCARYFENKDEYLGGFGAQLLAFAGAMFGLVIADDLLLMFIFWELTTVLSYLLIGYARTRLSARRSALQALVVTTAGGLAMLVGLIILGSTAGTYRIQAILDEAPALVAGPAGGAVSAAVVLILIGAITKSALVPFHFWLPGAMAAPTPVSAYLHAAAMVKAGIYLVARMAPGFAETAPWPPIVLGLGLATMLVGGYRALRQTDIKLILAYGTVSQLGFMTMVVGLGTPEAALAGLALLLAHGLFKATLFLVVGIIDHQAGTRDIRELSGRLRLGPGTGDRRGDRRGLDGRHTPAGRLRRQGIGVRGLHPVHLRVRNRALAAGRCGPGLHPDLRLQRPVHVGRVRRQARRGAHGLQTDQTRFPCRAGDPEPPHDPLRAVARPRGRLDPALCGALCGRLHRPRPGTWRCGTASPRPWA